ncbi:hypothetical protein JCM8208_000927 [Rhodotorula glutinis]
MLDLLPVELIRRILDLAHPAPSARAASFVEAVHRRQHFLGTAQAVSTTLKDIARELLWSTVHYCEGATEQLEHLVSTGGKGDEGQLVRTLDYQRPEQLLWSLPVAVAGSVALSDALSQMSNLVRLELNQNGHDNKLDLGVVARLDCLTTLIVVGNVKLVLPPDEPVDGFMFGQLKYLNLCKVIMSSSVASVLFSPFSIPSLKTLIVSRVRVDKSTVFPTLSRALRTRLHGLHTSVAEHADLGDEILAASPNVVAHLDERAGRLLAEELKASVARDEPPAPSLLASAKTLVLSTEALVLDRGPGLLLGAALLIARTLVQGGATRTLFRSRQVRTSATGYLVVTAAELHDQRAMREAHEALDVLCEARAAELEVFYLDCEADIGAWPQWARRDPVLRQVVQETEERDAYTAAQREADQGYWAGASAATGFACEEEDSDW